MRVHQERLGIFGLRFEILAIVLLVSLASGRTAISICIWGFGLKPESWRALGKSLELQGRMYRTTDGRSEWKIKLAYEQASVAPIALRLRSYR